MPLQLGLELEDESVLPLCVFFFVVVFLRMVYFWLDYMINYVFLFIVFWEVVGVFFIGGTIVWICLKLKVN